MLTIASNSSFWNGRWRTSAFTAVTASSTPASRRTSFTSSVSTHRSHAVTVTAHSRARNTEVAPRPDPKSRTRIPGRNARAGRISSSCHSGCGPISRSRSHRGSYREDRGKRSGLTRASIAGTIEPYASTVRSGVIAERSRRRAWMEPTIMYTGAHADTSCMNELQAVLDDLDHWFRAERPDMYSRFRPGLSQNEIRELETRLAPYRLPADLVTLYAWHDGWISYADEKHVSLMWDATFSSLGEAVDHYESMTSLMSREEDMPDLWHPLWFPAFGDQHYDFVELQPEPNRPAGGVWSWHTYGAEVVTRYDSVASLFA